MSAAAGTAARPGVLTALRIEAAAVSAGLGPAEAGRLTVRALGAGRRAAGAHALSLPAVAVAGVAGALAPGLRPGDLVVATRVQGPTHADRLVCPAAELLAGELRRRGLRVHTGPVATSSSLVTGAARDRLAGTGALAVDMESSLLARAAHGGPVVVVRAIVDGPGRPLLHPGTLWRGVAALRSLRAAAPVLAQWAAALASRTVSLAAPASFCAGVERAITSVEDTLRRHGAPVYVRRQIVHNAHVVADLEARGAVFVTELSEVPDGAVTVFSAHGVSPAVWTQAAAKSLRVIDATCPLVAKVHSEVRRIAARGADLLVYIGHPDHDETEGTLGEAPDRLHVVSTLDDVAALPPATRVRFVTQTTLAVDEAGEIVEALQRRYGAANVTAPASEDICYATSNRQAAVRAVAADADLVLVVGSQNSSNSQRLVEVAARAGTTARLVEDAGSVQLDWLAGARRVALSAGASAPPSLVRELTDALVGLTPRGPHRTEVLTRRVAVEDIAFTAPRETDPTTREVPIP